MDAPTFAGNVEVESMSTCVLYDPRTGTIGYVHRVITLRGGERPSEEDIESRAREAATNCGRDLPSLEALHVDGDAMREPGEYRVDPERRSLELERKLDVDAP